MADEPIVVDESKIIRFYHGDKSGIAAKITDGTINGSDFVVAKDTDELIFIDADKNQKPVVSRSKEAHMVNLGANGSVGSLKTGDTIDAGIDLDTLIKKLTQKSVPATYSQPGVTCRVASGHSAGNYEVGTVINTNIQGIFTKNDAGNLTSIEILKGGTPVATSTTSPVNATDQSFTLGDETVSFTAKAAYAEGAIKNDNLGDPSPEGHIAAGDKTSSAVSFTGKRKLFYGTGVGEVPAVTSAMVRALSNSTLAPTQGQTFNITVSVGQQYVVFAYPASLRDVNQVMYVETNDTGMASSFTKSTISVEGANGATGADYKVYTYGMATPAAAQMTFKVTI